MQTVPQVLVAGRLAGRVHGFVVLAEVLITLPLGKVPQDHHRVMAPRYTGRYDYDDHQGAEGHQRSSAPAGGR